MSEVGGIFDAFNGSQFIAQAVREDMSARQAIQVFRDNGVQISNQAFRSMYAEARDAVAGRDAIQALSYDAIPPADAYSTWAAGEADQYATFVTSYVRPVGSRDVEPRYFTHVTAEPHTPGDAADAAAGYLSDIEDDGNPNYPAAVHLFSMVTSMTRTTGR